MSNLSGHKRPRSELSPEYLQSEISDGWTELYFAIGLEDSLRQQLAETTKELNKFKKHLAEINRAYNEKLEEIGELKWELQYYKSRNPGNKEFDSEFFDDASAAWKANKKSKGKGEYEYIKK
jgi:uncharacterized protein YhaN